MSFEEILQLEIGTKITYTHENITEIRTIGRVLGRFSAISDYGTYMPLNEETYRIYKYQIEKVEWKDISRETALDLYVLTKLEETILTKDRITDEDIVDLSRVQEKYTYGWYILEQSVEDQLLSVMDFKKYILGRQ